MGKEKEWADWSDFIKGDVGAPVDPRSKPVSVGPTLKKGEVPRRPSDMEIRKAILGNPTDPFGNPVPRQPTDQQMFGHLEVTEEMAKKATAEWEGTFTRFFKTKHDPVEKVAKSDWGCRGPVNQNDTSQLTEEEKRILAIPVNPNSYKQ